MLLITRLVYAARFNHHHQAHTHISDSSQFMGLQYLDTYDVQACTDACTARAPDSEGGPCEFVNIWRAVNAGVVGSTTCSFVRTSSSFYDVPAT